MPCEPAATLFNNLISFDASCQMRGSYGANVNLTNENQQYDETLRYTTVQIILQATAEAEGIDPTCFEGNVRWVYGIVQHVGDSRGLSEDAISLTIRSFFAPLARKPINTEKYDSTVAPVLAEVVQTFASVPLALCDFNMTGGNKMIGVVSGGNMLDEIRKLAQAGEGDIYVGRTGLLTTADWKDNTDLVDVTIPDEAIISADISREEVQGPSRLRVRGRFISQYDCGLTQLGGLPKPSKIEPQKGKLVKCCENGIEQPECEHKERQTDAEGSMVDGKNAEHTIESGFKVNEITNLDQDMLMLAVTNELSDYIGKGNHEIEREVKGRIQPKNEIEGAQAKQGPLKDQVKIPHEMLSRMALAMGARNLGKTKLHAAPSGGGNPDKAPDEPDPMMIEMVVDDPDLQAEFGVITDEIENVYISTYETLFDVAVRAFQEFKMSRNSWTVNLKYLPCINVNQVVQFTTPDTKKTVTGLVRDVRVNYDASPRSEMAIQVESFEEIGSTDYCSDNLFLYPELCGTGASFPWIPSDSTWVYAADNHIVLDRVRSGVDTYVEQTVYDCEIGAEYTVTWTTENGTITGSVEAGGTGSSTSSIVFTCTATPITIRFTGTGGNRPLLSKPKMIKCVTK